MLNYDKLSTDFEYYANKILKIPDKSSGSLMPFVFNRAQRHVHDKIEEQFSKTGRVRVIILKSRQQGITTYAQGRGYWFTTSRTNCDTLIVSHDRPSATHIFSMSEGFYRRSPKEVRPSIGGRVRGHTMLFDAKDMDSVGLNSKYVVKQAGDLASGRSFTPRFFHGSEVPQWKDAKTLVNALATGMPKQGHTEIILESTAFGAGDYFHMQWMAAERGESDFVPVFLPWYWDDTYQQPLFSKQERLEIEESLDTIERWKGEAELLELFEKEGTTNRIERLKWRRWAIDNECSHDLNLFHQEYPSTAEEAFISSGSNIFDTNKLKEISKKAKKYSDQYSERGTLVETSPGFVEFQKHPFGLWTIYRKPRSGEKYHSAWDSAMGDKNGDFSAGLVIDNKFRDCCSYHGQTNTDVFSQHIRLTAIFYNKHTVVPEANYPGNATIDGLKRIYPHIYTRQEAKDRNLERSTEKLGWYTSHQKKGFLINAMHKIISDGEAKMYDVDGIWELLHFVRKKDGSTGAASGGHDDRAMARMICYYTADFPDQTVKFEGTSNARKIYTKWNGDGHIVSSSPKISEKILYRAWSFSSGGVACLTGCFTCKGSLFVFNEANMPESPLHTGFEEITEKLDGIYGDFDIVDIADEDDELVAKDPDQERKNGPMDELEKAFNVRFFRTIKDEFLRISIVEKCLDRVLANQKWLLVHCDCSDTIAGFNGMYRRVYSERNISGYVDRNRFFNIHKALQNLLVFLEREHHSATVAPDYYEYW